MLKILVIPILLIFHPVHVTVITIDQAQDSDSLKVFFRMYYDDFLRDYNLYDTVDNFSDSLSQEKPFPASLMNKYLNEKVKITVNNKQLKGKLLNMTMANNELCMNLLYKSDKKPKVITVRNMILTGLYTDQANMTIIHINEFEEGVRLTPDKTEQTFSLK